MEKLILEITHQGKASYQSLSEFPVIIGRAYDCDVVVPEITVSPRHLQIDVAAEGFTAASIGNENGTRLNKQVMSEGESIALSLPASLKMGELRARLIDPEMEVAPTQLTSNQGIWSSFLSNPWLAALLVVLTAITIVVSKHIRTPVQQEELIYFNALLLPMLGLFIVAFIIAVVSRLTKHRWAFVPALSIAGLLFLIPLLFDHLGHFLSYLTTSGVAATVLKYVTSFLLLPLLLTFYLRKVHYTRWLSAIGIAVLVTMPVSAFFASDLVQQMSNNSGFTPLPAYDKSLSALDIRMQKNLTVEDFLNQTETILEQQVKDLLRQQDE